ncbi:hypothetical protein [Pontivivens ytuae]|uniref:Tyr recombinase domain-containing protein n=1 Tax=Pontivivens ytuae TaxID=2789856 RepID=A0A7S9LQ48_9RHOB|nr:hypothetical protein [Pontivivens ytuae]QPH53229.1 hypothetical protein I0K15_15745 [Pontivivens ytuae]
MSVRADLPPGAISVVGRLFDSLADREEHHGAPSRAAFEAAYGSESTLALLLRVCATHVPEVGLAEARLLRCEYYTARPRAAGHGRTAQPATAPEALAPWATKKSQAWPRSWQELLPGLLDAPVREGTIRRHVASVDRCAALVPALRCPPRLGWLFGWELGRLLQDGSAGQGITPVAPRTISNYLGGLVALGLHGGLDADELDGLRAVRQSWLRKGRASRKGKQDRLDVLYASGGYEMIVQRLAAEMERARRLPAWTAEHERARSTSAILAVMINWPARTGDIAGWRLGDELVRTPWGEWTLRYRQEKTGRMANAGPLWPETGEILDLHLLAGRPARLAQTRFAQLRGANWLTQGPAARPSRWPSEQVKRVTGLPAHDLRTVAADYLRCYEAETAADRVAALLGHASRQAGAEYRSDCAVTAGQSEWQAIRARIAES